MRSKQVKRVDANYSVRVCVCVCVLMNHYTTCIGQDIIEIEIRNFVNLYFKRSKGVV
jgi:hypothetical protein